MSDPVVGLAAAVSALEEHLRVARDEQRAAIRAQDWGGGPLTDGEVEVALAAQRDANGRFLFLDAYAALATARAALLTASHREGH